MNIDKIRIDQSVNFSTLNTKDTTMKNWKNYIPMFPISTVEAIKSALTRRLIAEYAGVAARLVYQAVNEAHAMASQTLEPLLFLPALAEEKVQQAAAWSARQRALLQTGSLAPAI